MNWKSAASSFLITSRYASVVRRIESEVPNGRPRQRNTESLRTTRYVRQRETVSLRSVFPYTFCTSTQLTIPSNVAKFILYFPSLFIFASTYYYWRTHAQYEMDNSSCVHTSSRLSSFVSKLVRFFQSTKCCNTWNEISSTSMNFLASSIIVVIWKPL